jgi:acyl-CoA synthetase (AMP-forming)/AMP-acid ligase II
VDALNPNVAARLAERAARHPARAAIVEGRGRRRRAETFGGMAARVAALAAGLDRRGIGPGDRVLLFVPMSIDLYVVLLAVLSRGATAVFVDAWAGRARIDAAVRAASPTAFVGTPKAHLLRLLSPSVRSIPLHLVAGRGWLSVDRYAMRGASPVAVTVEAEAPALVTFTTGSTGAPKAAARSHAFLWAQHRALAAHLGLREDDVDMPTLPVFVLNNLALGVTTVLPDADPRAPGDADPAAILGQMEAEGVTTTSGSPAFYARLAAWARARGRRIPVRALFTGGAPVLPPLARLLADATVGEAHVVYGSTEAEPIAGIPAREMVRAAEEARGAEGVCVGAPVAEIDVRIVRAHDGPIVLGADGWAAWDVAPGDTGEVVVAGDHVLRGYLDDPAAERAAKVRDGDRVWHRTGDAAWRDGDGRLWLMGRVSARVRRGGRTWWPGAAEVRALTLPGVSHAAYVGLASGDGDASASRLSRDDDASLATTSAEGDVPAWGDAGASRPESAVAGAGDPSRTAEVEAVLCLEMEADASAADRAAVEARVPAALGPLPVDRVVVLPRIPRDPRHASKTDLEALRRLIAR